MIESEFNRLQDTGKGRQILAARATGKVA